AKLAVHSFPTRRSSDLLILLAKNNEGYRNLSRLNSIAFVEGFYYKPRIDFELLKKYSEELICLSACIAGQLPRLLMEYRLEEARSEEHTSELQSRFDLV